MRISHRTKSYSILYFTIFWVFFTLSFFALLFFPVKNLLLISGRIIGTTVMHLVCWKVIHKRTFDWFSLWLLYHRSFFFYLHRSGRGGTPAAGTTRTELFLEHRENARVFTWKIYPPAQKKEARKGPGNRLHVRFAPKTRFLLPTRSYCKRCRTHAIR